MKTTARKRSSAWGAALWGALGVYCRLGLLGAMASIAHPCLADSEPKPVGGISTGGYAEKVVVSGDHAYVLNGPDGDNPGLVVVDVKDPAKPTLVGHVPLVHLTPGALLALSEDRKGHAQVYVFDGVQRTLEVIDVHKPQKPTSVERFVAPDAKGVIISGQRSYVMDAKGGLSAFDITNPKKPVHVRTVVGTDVAVMGKHVYAVDGTAGLATYRVSLTALSQSEAEAFAHKHSVGKGPGTARRPNSDGEKKNIRSSRMATAASQNAHSSPVTALAKGEAGATPRRLGSISLTLVGSLSTTGCAEKVTVSGNYAYLSNGCNASNRGLAVANIANPAAPSLAAFLSLPNPSYAKVALSGNYAYVSSWGSALYIINVNNPASPSVAGTFAASGGPYGVAVVGGYAYLCDYYSFKIVNVANPSATSLVGSTLSSNYGSVNVEVVGSYAYVACQAGMNPPLAGLYIVNVSNPAVPAVVGSLHTTAAGDLAVAGNYAYVADGSGGLRVINISNPAAPALVGTYATPAAADVAVAGNYAYVTDGTNGLSVLDISNPTAPSLVCNAAGTFGGVAVAGNYVYVAALSSGLRIYQISGLASLQSIAVTPANPSVIVGSTQQFTATGTYSDSSTKDITSTVTWTSSNTSKATVNSSGLATAVAAGSTTVSATLSGVTGQTTLTVTSPVTLQSIAVTPANPAVVNGGTQQFTATGTYSDSSTKNITSTVTWSSSNTAKATINSAGLATGVAEGTTTISATSSGITGQTTLTVTSPVTLQSIAVTPANPSVAIGGTQQFTATGTYSDSSTKNITSTVTWSSSNTAKATINSSGLAIAVAAGFTTVSATLSGITGQTTLTVTPPLQSITVTPTSPSLVAGDTQQFTATGTYTDSSTKDITSTVTWSSSNTAKATINSTGLATALAAGTTTISAALSGITGQATLTVTPATLQSIAVTPTNPSVAAGGTQQFAATGTYSDGSTRVITNTVTWASSNTNIATVNNYGSATAVAAGTANIIATLSGISGQAQMTVTVIDWGLIGGIIGGVGGGAILCIAGTITSAAVVVAGAAVCIAASYGYYKFVRPHMHGKATPAVAHVEMRDVVVTNNMIQPNAPPLPFNPDFNPNMGLVGAGGN